MAGDARLDAGLDELLLNGVDVDTGTYLTPALRVSEVASALRGDPAPPAGARELRRRQHEQQPHLGVAYGRDPQQLASVGWGLVVPDGLDPAIEEAVQPLVRLRAEQAGPRFKRLEVRPGEDKDAFLARYGMGPSVADPRKVPYYLLLLGDPELLPFEFQYQLGVSYAVGRLDLRTVDDYAAYAGTVVSAEASLRGSGTDDHADGLGADRRLGAHPRPGAPVEPSHPSRSLALFAPRHPGDTPTGLSSSRLVEPLLTDLQGTTDAWGMSADVGAPATRARLLDLLTDDGADILFTAGHGLGGSTVASREVAGALLCQDWPGPLRHRGPLDEAHYLGADGLTAGRPVRPKIVFSFACFGAGTPRVSDYPGGQAATRAELSDRSFTSRLPQRLLAEPSGGALAFVGHVDRAWTCSFLWKGMDAQVTAFSSTLLALMDGVRLGNAMESLTARYAEVATELTHRLEQSRKYGKRIPDADLVGLWTATHDARGYVVLGDPAVQVAPLGAARLHA